MLSSTQTGSARRILTGAAVGFLAGLAWVALDLSFVHYDVGAAMPWVGAAIGAMVAWRRWLRVASAGAIAVAIAAGLLLCTPLLRAPVVHWIRRDPFPAGPVDAVVVLSSNVNADGALDDEGATRLLGGLALLSRYPASMLITTRVVRSVAGRTATTDGEQRALVALAGDTARWRIVGPVANTHDEAMRTAALLAPAAGQTVVVVTSPLHTRRACATFEALGFRVVCQPSEERSYAVYAFTGLSSRLRALHDYLYERLAMVKYRVHGWVRA
jgi:uncharacterized SAM-binding protein YcdF (DUF218 family)